MNNPWPPLYDPNAFAPRRRAKRWAIWAVAMVFTPGLVMAAYQPGFLLPSNNLSDVSSASTSRTNLGAAASATTITTTAPMTGGGDLSANRTFAVSAATATASGLVPTPPNNTTTFLRGDATFASAVIGAVAPTIYTSTLPVTLANTHGLVEVIEMATPASGTINLPASPTAGMIICVKDGLKNFAANVATVKTTDSSTIDKVAGATGFAMNQNGQYNCFQYASAGTNWYVQ